MAVRTEKGLGIDSRTRVDDCGHLGMINRNSGQKDAVLSTSDDFSVLDDDSTERSTPPVFHGFDREPDRLVEELFLQFVAFEISGAHGFSGGSAGVENSASFP